MSEVRISDRVSIIRALPEHIEMIAPRAREADCLEVYAAARQTVAEALAFSMKASEMSFTGLLDGKPEAMFGVGTVNAIHGVGCPWLLGTDAIDRQAKTFMGGSRMFVSWCRGRYSILQNVVDDRHVKSKRWLARLGFTLHEPEIMGYERRPFRRFEMRTE